MEAGAQCEKSGRTVDAGTVEGVGDFRLTTFGGDVTMATADEGYRKLLTAAVAGDCWVYLPLTGCCKSILVGMTFGAEAFNVDDDNTETLVGENGLIG